MNHMHVSAELKARVQAKLDECVKISGINTGKITVLYDINSARLGGQAIYSTNTIRLNPVFLNAHTEHYLATTVPHEWAHLAAHKKYGRMISAHGREWKSTMHAVGVRPDRCHNYTVPAGISVGKQTKKHTCHCDRCGEKFEVGTKMLNNINSGRSYRHNRCGGKVVVDPVLKLTGKMVSIPTTKAVAHTVPVAQPSPASGQSKLDICRRLWNDHNNLPKAPQTRATMIDLFITFAGCTPAGASTYYQKLKAELG